MTILITGGTGLIGSYLSRRLLSEGYDLLLFDINPNFKLISDIKDKIKVFQGDITSLSSIIEAIKSHEVTDIFHLAAIISVAAERNPLAALKINSLGTVNVLEAARIFDIDKLLFPSTSVVYQNVENPIEGSPEEPNIIYGVTKVTCENWCRYYRRRYNLNIRGARFISIIGPGRKNGGASRFTSLMIEKAALDEPFEIYVDETLRVPILYIKDAVDALITLFKAKKVNHTFYNIGGIQPSAGEIASKVKKVIPDANLTFNPDPSMIKVLDGWPNLNSTRIKNELGWHIRYDLDRMVEDFITTIRNNREIYT